jgi:hypothetical protein
MKKSIVMATALGVLVAAPAFAQSPAPAKPRSGLETFGAVTPFGSPAPMRMDAARETALRECSAMGARYSDKDSIMPVVQFRMCMAQKGQPE